MNPRAGGAELVTFEIARRLVQRGDSVEWFSAGFPGAPSDETIEGIRIVRGGRQWSVHWSAYRRYRGHLSSLFDVVIDEVNTIPFFTPLWSDIPAVMFIHQLARDVWWYESPFPLNALGFLAEPFYLRPYRMVQVLTVSSSTEHDLRSLGFKGSITVIPEGLDGRAEVLDKLPEPSFVFVGRMAPSKRIEHILKALALFRHATGAGTLCLVGSGSDTYRLSLMNHADRLGIADHVDFRGHVSPMEKWRLMATAHCLLLTSVREGWGLVVSEANACGTPAIVYDVPGLRDSVHDELTGLVVPARPQCLADAMIRLMSDPMLYADLVAEGRTRATSLSFDQTARVVEHALDRASVE
jgi:glycosyltransferase involved in cell wall biosynthesis